MTPDSFSYISFQWEQAVHRQVTIHRNSREHGRTLKPLDVPRYKLLGPQSKVTAVHICERHVLSNVLRAGRRGRGGGAGGGVESKDHSKLLEND